MKKIVLILLSLTVCIVLPAQPQLRFQNYETRDGLSHYHVNCLHFDSWGFLWIGTEFGLNRFDGVTFEKWFHIPGDTTSLIHNKINSIEEDQQQRLWISTDKGISVYNFRNGKFNSFRKIHTQNAGTIIPEQPNFFCDRDGDIWIGHTGGAAILYKTAANEFFSIPLQLSPSDRMQNRYVGGFLEDKQNRIWVATSYGIYRLSKTDLTASAYRIDEANKNGPLLNTCTNIFETNQGHLLCGTWNAGFLIFDELQNSFKPFYSVNGPFRPNPVVFNFGQLHQTIFIATIGGLFSCEEKDLTKPGFDDFQLYASDPNDPSAIISMSVNSILTDTTGNLWIGGERGLSLLRKNYKHYKSYSFNPVATHNNGSPVSIEQDDHHLLVAVANELLIFDLQTETFRKANTSIRDIGFHRFIKSGKHFYQLSRSSLIMYNENMELLKTFNAQHPQGYRMNIFNAMEDSKGNVWAVTSRYGLIRHSLDGRSNSYLHDSTQTIHSVGDIIGDIAESKSGNIYAGGKHLFMLHKDNEVFTSLSILNEKSKNEIRALKMTDGILWIGSRNGLYSYNEKSGKIIHHNLPPSVNQVIEELETDDLGNVWMVTSSGLLKYNPADSSTFQYNDKTGFPRTFSVIKKLEDGRIAAGSSGEILIIDPQELKPETYSPQPYITQLVIDENLFYLMPEKDTTYRLKYNQSIRFHYVSLTYHNASNNSYAWKMQGMDNLWHDANTLTSQAFATLAPGRYSFSVKSANASNVWTESPSTIHFIVSPPFYRTAWFIALVVLTIGGLIYLFYRYRLHKALQIERMRTRIATDLHDDIGATLSSISFYSEAVNQKTKHKLPEVSPILEKMGESSRTMVSSMSDIVWAINPLNDDMGKMLDRMQAYAKELAAIKEKSIHISIDEKAHHLKPQLEQRRNIYLIFKEALTNALKYASGSQIWINITLSGNLFHMQIADDGKGFEPSAEGEGNGIKNMQRRAADIGAAIKIKSGINQGTVIDLELII